MEPQYYYNRYSEYPTKAYCPPWETQGPENRLSWHKCSKERGKKRFDTGCDNESFYHYVAVVTETKTEISVREAFVGEDWQGFVSMSLNKKGIFGEYDAPGSTKFILSLFANAMNSCVDEVTGC